MVNIIHVSDVHLGAKFVWLGNKGKEQRERLAEAFKKLPQLAATHKVQLILISGDLFDSPYPSKHHIDTVKSVIETLLRQEVAVGISAGTHDYLCPGCVYTTDSLKIPSDLLCIFNEPRPLFHYFPKINVSVSARSLDSNRSHHSPMEGLMVNPQAAINIAMAHGSVLLPGLRIEKDDWPMKLEEIQNSQFDYVALGHWHGAREIIKGKAWYSGSPEWLSVDQKKSGNMLLVSIDLRKVTVTPIPVGTTKFDVLEIDVGTCRTIDELRSKIVIGSDRSLIRQVVLKGIRPETLVFDVRHLEEELSVDFWSLRIEDRSVAKVEGILGEDKTLIAQFIKKMREKSLLAKNKEERREIDEASWIGVKLLKGEEAGL